MQQQPTMGRKIVYAKLPGDNTYRVESPLRKLPFVLLLIFANFYHKLRQTTNYLFCHHPDKTKYKKGYFRKIKLFQVCFPLPSRITMCVLFLCTISIVVSVRSVLSAPKPQRVSRTHLFLQNPKDYWVIEWESKIFGHHFISLHGFEYCLQNNKPPRYKRQCLHTCHTKCTRHIKLGTPKENARMMFTCSWSLLPNGKVKLNCKCVDEHESPQFCFPDPSDFMEV